MERDPVVRMASRRAYHERHKERRLAESKNYKARTRRDRVAANSKLLYGVSKEAVEGMRAGQQDCCAICRMKKKLCIDHNHETNKIRALLCRTCNSGLGMFKDSLGLLRNAGQYLLDH